MCFVQHLRSAWKVLSGNADLVAFKHNINCSPVSACEISANKTPFRKLHKEGLSIEVILSQIRLP